MIISMNQLTLQSSIVEAKNEFSTTHLNLYISSNRRGLVAKTLLFFNFCVLSPYLRVTCFIGYFAVLFINYVDKLC